MNAYRITGELTYNQSEETEDGFNTIEITEDFECDAENCERALDFFLAEHDEYEFYGMLKTCDAETYGKKGAHFFDQNEQQAIDVELIEN